MNKITYWLQAFKLAIHILKHLPPKDGHYHAVSYNIKLKAPRVSK